MDSQFLRKEMEQELDALIEEVKGLPLYKGKLQAWSPRVLNLTSLYAKNFLFLMRHGWDVTPYINKRLREVTDNPYYLYNDKSLIEIEKGADKTSCFERIHNSVNPTHLFIYDKNFDEGKAFDLCPYRKLVRICFLVKVFTKGYLFFYLCRKGKHL